MRKVPYERIKVTDIVREAGVSRMTYYRHFKTKSDVLASLIDYIIKDVNPVCHENRRNGDWYRFWLTLFDYADRYASALKTIIEAGQEQIILECLNRSAFPHLQKDESSETSYRLYFLSGAMYNVFIEWLKKERRENARRNGVRLLFVYERLGFRRSGNLLNKKIGLFSGVRFLVAISLFGK